MARSKLDQNKPYGRVTPPYLGAVTHQGGTYFDVRDNEIFSDEHDTEAKKQASIDKWTQLEEQAEKMRTKKAQKAAPTPKEDDGTAGEEAAGDGEGTGNQDDEAVDLRAWAMKTKKYHWFAVKKAIDDQFSRDVTKKVDAIDTLIEKGIVTADEVVD